MDISNYTNSELKDLCSDIRKKIIDNVSKKGGYLSSNLSIVEITAVLNKCFNAEDKIIFSGNDMNYSNNIINDKNIFEGEKNDSLSVGLGICNARDLDHDKYNVISVINSNGIFSGANIESLNQIGLQKKKMIIVFNDDTSINEGIGIVDKFISNLRNTRTYNNIKDNVKDLIRPKKGGEKIIESIHNFKSNIKKSVIDEGIFAEYNIDYIGPIDGHNISELERAFEVAKQKEYPVVIHCITTKGKGYVYSESCTNDCFNYTKPFDIKTGKKLVEENENNLEPSTIISNNLLKLMNSNDKIVIVSSNNKNENKLNKLFAKYPERCFDVGNDFNVAINFSIGLAKVDKLPYLFIDSNYLSKCYDSLVNNISDDLPLTICLANCDANNNVLLNNLKNINIATASNADEIGNLLFTGSISCKPLMIRTFGNLIENTQNDEFKEINLGKWQKITNNNIGDKVIISEGENIQKIQKALKDNKIKCTLINAIFFNPIDEKMLKKIFATAKEIFIYNSVLSELILKESLSCAYNSNLTILDNKTIKELISKIE